MNFIQKLEKIVKKNNSLLCVGLDSDFSKLPERFKKQKYPQFAFNKLIIKKTADLVCAYKPNSAFYEARGEAGIKELKMTFDYLREKYPEIVTILDAKRADIGSTNKGYVQFIFDYLEADGVTLNPYLGRQALEPFLERKDKGCLILCRTSNPGAGEFQDLGIAQRAILRDSSEVLNLYEVIAQKVAREWNINKNCLLVVGATYPKELAKIRKLAGDNIWFLIPGVGVQGGDVEKTVLAGQNSRGDGMIINSSRGIIFAGNGGNFAQEARKKARALCDSINKYRNYEK